ncbi:MAG: VCBS repeat-containing protein [Myxococcales bacterium]|nr:VCBS repeat-containing protein [Myxococcales bacterium]
MIDRRRLSGLVAVTLSLLHCGGDPTPTGPSDAGGLDAGRLDVTVVDSVVADRAADTGGVTPFDAGVVMPQRDAGPTVTCAPFGVDPSRVRIATNAGVTLRSLGGSGRGALFTVNPGVDTGGATVSIGGGIVAGPRAARFQVQVADLLCSQRASVEVEVVGPFAVEPSVVEVTRSTTFQFRATGNLAAVRWDVLIAPPGGNATLDAATGRFSAGTVLGDYRLRARDSGSGIEIQIAARVSAMGGFAPLHTTMLVPRGRRIKLLARGGSGALDAAVMSGPAGGTVVSEGSERYFDATNASPGTRVLNLTDRFTNERATMRVVVGDEVAPTPVARGATDLLGDVALGDLNADGRLDLAVGHANRARVANFAGGVLIYYGQSDGRFAATPSVVLEGERENDRVGTTLRVRDVDGDMIDDLVVGSALQDLGRDARGVVSVYLGSRQGLVTTPERSFAGDAANDRFGNGLVVDDLDGDGVSDLVVVAPNASNPFAVTACRGAGRATVYRGVRGARGLFVTVPWQVVELRDRLGDADGPGECRTGSDAGRGTVLFDVDADGRRDLVVGVPGTASTHYGSVLVYRATAMGAPMPFEPNPSWVIHPEMAWRTAGSRIGLGLDVVPVGANREVLVVRAPSLVQGGTQTGGFLVFAPSAFPARLPSGEVRVVMGDAATARFVGGANDGAARAGAVGDFDGDGAVEYAAAGASNSTQDGEIHTFTAASLGGSGVLTPSATARGEMREFVGGALASRAAMRGATSPVVALSSYRTTSEGFAMGALRWMPAGVPGSLPGRFTTSTLMNLPGFAAGDRTGSGLGWLDGTSPAVFVGSPQAHSPAIPMMGMTAARDAGFRQRTGVVDQFAGSNSAPSRRFWVDRDSAQMGAAITTLDFDGDGRLDLAIGDPGGTAGGRDWVTQSLVGNAADDRCFLRTNNVVQTNSSGGRGLVRIYLQQSDGSLAERFWAIAQESIATGGTFRRGGFGASLNLTRVDVNNDGRDDLVVGHSNGATTNGAEVILGQTPNTMGRVMVVCNDPSTAPRWPERADTWFIGRAVAGLGDLDGDGCDETAANFDTGGRAGVLVQYGFGARCGRNTRPYAVYVVADDRPLRDNVVGDAASRNNDVTDLTGAATGMGAVVAGGGDLNGDQVPDLVFRDNNLQVLNRAGTAIEVLSGATLNAVCPDRVCDDGLRNNTFNDGDYHVVGVRPLEAPERIVRGVPDATSVRFATAITVADLDGDGVSDLVVGAADDSEQGDFAGAVMAWRASNSPAVWAGPPWLYGVGDPGEASQFGGALAVRSLPMAGAYLAVGAPFSNHRGAQTGAAYRWRIER